MTPLSFLMEWALRSATVVLAAALLLRALRVKDPSVRLAAWTAVLFGSLLIPAVTSAVPRLSVALVRSAPPAAVVQRLAATDAGIPVRGAGLPAAASSIDWPRVVLLLYALGAAAMLLRLSTGLMLSHYLVRRSRSTGRSLPGGLPVHESAGLAVPAALGVFRPVVVLPQDWREWEDCKLEAILAHERSHVRRRDPAVQLVSAIHRRCSGSVP